MSKLFISHSTKDKRIVEQLVDFLVLGMGIEKKDIFCTALNSALHTGTQFIPHIRKEMKDCKRVILLITKNYLESKFCLAELGAAWMMNGSVLPLLGDSVQNEDLTHTPLLGIQTRSLNRTEDLFTIYDELCAADIVTNRVSAELSKRLPDFLAGIEQVSSNTQILQPNARGYYVTQIEAIREVPSIYRCYRINGLVDCINPLVQGESQWLFYQANMYQDLKVGDTVEFSVSKTELRQFQDLKNARNIYPAELFKQP